MRRDWFNESSQGITSKKGTISGKTGTMTMGGTGTGSAKIQVAPLRLIDEKVIFW